MDSKTKVGLKVFIKPDLMEEHGERFLVGPFYVTSLFIFSFLVLCSSLHVHPLVQAKLSFKPAVSLTWDFLGPSTTIFFLGLKMLFSCRVPYVELMDFFTMFVRKIGYQF